MDTLTLFVTASLLLYVGFIIYVANVDQINGQFSPLLRWLLFGVIGLMGMFSLLTLQAGLLSGLPVEYLAQMQASGTTLPVIDMGTAFLNFALTAAACAFSAWLILMPTPRTALKRVLVKTAFNPEAPVHITAIILSLALLTYTIGNLILGGGVSGLASEIAENGVSLGETIFNQVLWVIAALLGVGLMLRRTPQETAARLATRFPTVSDVVWGIGVGLAMFGFVIGVAFVWTALVAPEQFAEQTAASEALAQAFDTLPAAFALSLAVAIGEEIFFRGALQPVFGLGITSIFFALLHTQYTLTPASATIVVVAVALGILRQRQSTTAAVIAHFVYNFIQLSLAILASSLIGG
jgi:membrane protease YdiL (CAAX protease family)